MTRETKIGIAMVLVLVGVFGFLVYKRATRPNEALAQTETVEDGDQDSLEGDADSETVKPSDDLLADDSEELPTKIVPVAGKSRPIPQDEPEDDLSDPFGEEPSQGTSAKNSQPQLLTSTDDEPANTDKTVEEFDSLASEEEETTSTANDSAPAMTSSEPDVDGSDPFAADSAEAATETTAETTITIGDEPDKEPAIDAPAIADKKSSPVLEFETTESEDNEKSFGVEEPIEEPVTQVPVKSIPAAPLPVKPSPVKSSPVKSFGDDEEPDEEISVSARASIPDRALDFGEEDAEDAAPETDAAMEPVAEFDPQPKRIDEPMEEPVSEPFPEPVAAQPAPELMLDDSSEEDRYGDYEPIEIADADEASPFADAKVRSDAPPRPAAKGPRIAGNRHVVQSGENFWSISQKKYGTGRYFQALAAHNQAVVPDPSKMKLGVQISLPPEEELERRYPTLVSPTGVTEPGAATGSAGPVRGEYLVDADGQPKYRIGTGDTLSDIAQRYLGRSRRWEQILVMNRDILKDGNTLKVGAVLRLPSDAVQLQLSNQPREFR